MCVWLYIFSGQSAMFQKKIDTVQLILLSSNLRFLLRLKSHVQDILNQSYNFWRNVYGFGNWKQLGDPFVSVAWEVLYTGFGKHYIAWEVLSETICEFIYNVCALSHSTHICTQSLQNRTVCWYTKSTLEGNLSSTSLKVSLSSALNVYYKTITWLLSFSHLSLKYSSSMSTLLDLVDGS